VRLNLLAFQPRAYREAKVRVRHIKYCLAAFLLLACSLLKLNSIFVKYPSDSEHFEPEGLERKIAESPEPHQKKGFLPQAKKKYVRHNHEEQHAQKKFNHE